MNILSSNIPMYVYNYQSSRIFHGRQHLCVDFYYFGIKK